MPTAKPENIAAMPMYEYQDDRGNTTLVHRPVEERDAAVFIEGRRCTRRTVPSRISIGTGAKPPTMGERLSKGYKKLEETGGLTDKNKTYLPVETIKKALAMPDVHDTPAERAQALAER